MPVVAVVLGGLVGTSLRIGLDALLPHGDARFPWSTLLVNVVGSLALGLLVARVWPAAPAWLRAGLGTGLLGSFTTFSAFAVSLVTMTRSGMGALAVVYLAASVVGGLAAAAAGILLGRTVRTPGPEPLEPDE